MSTRLGRLVAPLVALVVVTACTRGADEARLQTDLQARLDHEVKDGLFQVVGLRREGSAPLPAGETGAPRVVVYFNATLRLQQDYSFGGWDQLAPPSVAYVLGATEKGLFGLQAANRSGDMLRAYGSAIYERPGDEWLPVAADGPAATAAAPSIDGTAPPSRSKQMIDKLAAMVELPPPGVPADQDDIIAEELARASENIERRVKRREHTFTIATGAPGSEYARFGDAIVAEVGRLTNVKLRQRHTDGSVDNAWLLSRGEADYAVVQADVAAAAVAGAGPFARGGPLSTLRAVGGLFPEAIHVVVPAGSPLQSVADLRGRRVGIGAPASGTRFDAVAVLEAHGLKLTDLAEAREEGLAAALERLQRRQLDALFVTTTAPARALQQLAVRPGLRLLPITGAAAERLMELRPGLTQLTLPPNTYPQQKTAVTTMAAAALLLTTADAPAAEVERVTDLVFTRMPQQQAGADVVKVSNDSRVRVSTIPLHGGAITPTQ